MPLKRCQTDGESGWKWGDQGKCYVGPDARAKALAQGVAIGDVGKSFDAMRERVGLRKADEKMALDVALDYLDAAIELHEAHMDGSEPTSDESQEKLMNLMKEARQALQVHQKEMVG